MKTPDKRSKEILAAARKAVSKIADPALRAKATAKLDATQKKLSNARRQSRAADPGRQQTREQDLDFDR